MSEILYELDDSCKGMERYPKNSDAWIEEKSLLLLPKYELGEVTIRGLHYQLVSHYGMQNDEKHSKKVSKIMTQLREEGTIPMNQFSDHEREITSVANSSHVDYDQSVANAKRQIRAWMRAYRRNRWERQPYYPMVVIEKKALLGVFTPVCDELEVGLAALKGYSSITHSYNMSQHFKYAIGMGQKPIILYFGDYDPSGLHIPDSLRVKHLSRLMGVDVILHRIAVNAEQIEKYNLPQAMAKEKDRRAKKYMVGIQVELDSIDAPILKDLVRDAVSEIFDENIHNNLMGNEIVERAAYQQELKKYVDNL